jgi:signal transduction histidine kinase/GAF domain-containing protein
MRLYDEAIRLAHEHGFTHDEAIANELAARFYAARGIETIAHFHLRNARDCYLRWGADGKVRQLEQLHPRLRQEPALLRSDNTIGTPIEDLDLAIVVKVSQAVSGEIDLRRLINILLVTALEHAGGERGLLILSRDEELRIEAEATTIRDAVEVRLRQERVAPAELPESVMRYVIRTADSVLLHDASEQNPYSGDEYIRRNHCRSILCLPLVKQARLIGVLYLENNLAPYVFTPARIAVLRLLASQAAISLENARLYADLQRVEALLAEAQRLSHTGSFRWHVGSGDIFWSEESFRIFEYDPATKPTMEMVLSRVHPDDVALVQQALDHAAKDKQGFDFEHRLLMPDGSLKHLHVVAHAVTDEAGQFQLVGALMDITARKQAHAALERSEHRYRHLFRDMPVALWQLDARPLIAFLKELRAQGVEDLSAYFDDQPDLLRRVAALSTIEEVNDYAVQMFGARDRSELLGPMLWVWRESPDTLRRAVESRYRSEELFQETTKLPTLDGRVIDVLYTVARPRMADNLGITLISLVDLTEQVRAEENLRESERRYHEAQMALAHANRVTTMGQLTASIAHEITQPVAATVTNADTALCWLDAQPPDLEEVRQALGRIVRDSKRASDVIGRIRAIIKKAPRRKDGLEINKAILDVIALTRGEAVKNGVSVETQLAEGLPLIQGDRVQLRQVILNLIINAVEAMSGVSEGSRDLLISTGKAESDGVLVAVRDSGPGLTPAGLEHLFEAFYTTKPGGLGMGLSICRSIIEAHRGQLWATANVPQGAILQFTLPAHPDSAS